MSRAPLSAPVQRIAAVLAPVERFFTLRWELRDRFGDAVCDFAAGDPQEMPPGWYVDTLQRWAEPKRPDWFAYKNSEPEAQAVVAKALREHLGIAFEPEDVAMTNAAIAGLAVTLRTICEEGDEVIIVSPPHFLYEPLILAAGATTIRVRVKPEDFDLDLDAISSAITQRTRAIIVNTPHNPTGRIFPPETLDRLAGILSDASARHQPIYLISDEAYHKILFDGRTFTSPAAFYPRSFVVYSYGKILLAPGQRIGFVAMPPTMPDRELLRIGLVVSQIVVGFAFPNALLQHALPDLDPMTIDLEHLQGKRDRMVPALREAGYELHVPEATFYLMPRSPIQDDVGFCELLAEDGVLCMPGQMLEWPGYFRISLSASDDMIDRSLPVFARAFERART